MARGARRSGQKQGLLARLRRSDAARPAELSEEPNELSTPAATHDSGTADEQDKATEAPATAGGAVPPGPHSEGTFYDELPWEAEHARQGEEAEHARQEAYEHGYDDRYDDGYEELYLPEEDWAHIPEQGWAPEHGTYVYPGQVGPAYRAGATYPGLVPTGRAKAARPAGPWPRLVMVAAVAVVAAAVTLALTPPRTSKPLAQATAESTTAPSRSSSTTTAPKTTTTTAPTTTAPDRTTTTARPHRHRRPPPPAGPKPPYPRPNQTVPRGPLACHQPRRRGPRPQRRRRHRPRPGLLRLRRAYINLFRSRSVPTVNDFGGSGPHSGRERKTSPVLRLRLRLQLADRLDVDLARARAQSQLPGRMGARTRTGCLGDVRLFGPHRLSLRLNGRAKVFEARCMKRASSPSRTEGLARNGTSYGQPVGRLQENDVCPQAFRAFPPT